MLILSKYKDYYDYLSGIYGVDNKIVLDRTKADPAPYFITGSKIVLAICDQLIEGYYHNDKFYWKEGLAQFGEYVKREKWGTDTNYYRIPIKWANRTTYLHIHPDLRESKQNINTENGCAIGIVGLDYKEDKLKITHNYPKLQDLSLNKIIPAQEIYILLTEWLAPKDIQIDNRSDKEKIKSQGFDIITSFRH